MSKKYIKEAETAVKKLRGLGVKVNFSIEQ
jgi:hypothetical protein